MSIVHRSFAIVLRMVAALGCLLGVWYSWSFARADYLFHKDTLNSVQAAIRLVPDSAEYYLRLAQLDRIHAQQLLTKALSLNRYNAQAFIELGLRYEAEGDYAQAEKQLLESFEVDRTYLPRWSLASFYFRRGDIPAFWSWARRAAEMPAEETGPLFELCWRVSPDTDKIAQTVVSDRPEALRQYLSFLEKKAKPNSMAAIAERLVRFGDSDTDRNRIFLVIDRLIAADDVLGASELWRALKRQNWIAADSGWPNNGRFSREPLPVSFDWALPEYSGLHSWPGSSGLESEFTGVQPEDCTIAEQFVVLPPGKYTMEYSYRTSDIAPDTGIRWQVVDASSNLVLAQSADLSGTELQRAELKFSVPPGDALLRLRLAYQRTLGTSRISGTLLVASTEIRRLQTP